MKSRRQEDRRLNHFIHLAPRRLVASRPFFLPGDFKGLHIVPLIFMPVETHKESEDGWRELRLRFRHRTSFRLTENHRALRGAFKTRKAYTTFVSDLVMLQQPHKKLILRTHVGCGFARQHRSCPLCIITFQWALKLNYVLLSC